MEFYAHIDKSENNIRRQTLAEHCRNTAKYASDCLKPIGLESVGYLSGLLHDLGKSSKRAARYLTEGIGTRGSVIHSFQGCRMLLEHFHHSKATEYSDITSELIAYAVGAHHGLFDCIDLDGMSGLQHRMTDEGTSYRETVENFTAQCADWAEIEARFREANAALEPIYQQLNGPGDGNEKLFYIGLLERMILSAVIEGDRRDTAEFMDHITVEELRKWSERAKAYTVSLYQGDIEKARLYTRHGITVLTDGFYDENTGVTPEGGNMPFLEVQS